MDDSLSDFYVTLPSNVSMTIFPNNTQSSYRTKLSSPLFLGGDWEVGLSEICMPRNWFNVNSHNNFYTLTYEKEENIINERSVYEIRVKYRVGGGQVEQFWQDVNDEIQSYLGLHSEVRFDYVQKDSTVGVQLPAGFELRIPEKQSSKLLYMLHLPEEDFIQKNNTTFRFRPSRLPDDIPLVFYLTNSNPKSVLEHYVTLMPYLGNVEVVPKTPKDFFNALNYNLNLLDLQDFAQFEYNESKNTVNINIAEHTEIRVTTATGASLLAVLKLGDDGDVTLTGKNTFKVKFTGEIKQSDQFTIIVNEYGSSLETKKLTEHLYVQVGMYKTPEDLFRTFKHVHLECQQNMHVALTVPEHYELTLGRHLADMLGFKETIFQSGTIVGEYPIQLHAGITEIFIYSDVIQSVHVGDTTSPLLRIIPCMNEHKEQIVKFYDRPLYVPMRKKFIESIAIELRSSTGDKITFTGGKTYVVLSFRRKHIK